MPGPADADAATWLVLIYQFPVKPTVLRGTIRRMLTAADAVYLSRACAALPSSVPAERVMHRARSLITDAGGSAVLLRARIVDPEAGMIAAFNMAHVAGPKTDR